MEELRKSVAELLGEPADWPDHGNAPLAIAATMALLLEGCKRLEAENATLKRDLQYARDGLTKGRTRMREDIDRLRRELKAAERFAKPRQPLDPLEVEELWDKANEEWGASMTDAAEPFRGEDAFHHFARLLERAHGIGA